MSLLEMQEFISEIEMAVRRIVGHCLMMFGNSLSLSMNYLINKCVLVSLRRFALKKMEKR